MSAAAARMDGAVHAVPLDQPDDFDGWRDAARALLLANVPPAQVSWSEPGGSAGDLFAARAETAPAPPVTGPPPAVPRAYLALARTVLLHADPRRFHLLYDLLWRLRRQPGLIEDGADPDMRRLHRLAREVRRDIHKMRAFLRFREVTGAEGPRFVAWFEPAHYILRANAAFFVNRFTTMRWSILTPRGSLHWDGARLQEGPPARREDAPRDDDVEALWTDYYAAIFNPARLKIGAMLKEMPRKYWKNMPETALIPALVAGAQVREGAMVDAGRDLFADAERPGSLTGIAQALQACRRCPIGCNGTRAVAGEGGQGAALMIVGEQPGDVEEAQGRPFVGPAGRLLMTHLEAAGIDRRHAYVTNAVKHFKFSPRGKRRIHETPTAREIDICRWWLEGERALVRPRHILALGATAARGILGKSVSVQKVRGEALALPDGTQLWVTTHPSYLLRLSDDARPAEEARFAQDLRRVAERLG